MKTLTLLRHAKSGWDDPVARDFDRPLNAKGRRAAVAVGAEMRRLGLRFDRVVASPAVRVAETLDAVAEGYGAPLRAEWERRVYLASAETLADVAREQPDAAARVLLVGHNPGLEELVLALVPGGASGGAAGDLRRAVEGKYPTASLVEMRLDVDRWTDVAEGGAELARFVRPRDLDPSLGPDPD